VFQRNQILFIYIKQNPKSSILVLNCEVTSHNQDKETRHQAPLKAHRED